MDKKECRDVTFQHPFRSIIVGPSGCGKSTFVKNLLLHQNELLSVNFDTIYIFLGTSMEENQILSELQELLGDTVKIIELSKVYPLGLKKSSFKEDLCKIIASNSQRNAPTCIIFDDLMSELAEIQLLDEIFTKWSSHSNMSVIHITQNLFHKGKGNSSCATTLYRNTQILVLFNCPMDHTTLRIVASRLSKGNRNSILNMLNYVVSNYKYVIIRTDAKAMNTFLEFTSDLFAVEPFRHFKAFTLEN